MSNNVNDLRFYADVLDHSDSKVDKHIAGKMRAAADELENLRSHLPLPPGVYRKNDDGVWFWLEDKVYP